MLKRIIPYAHHLLQTVVNENDTVIDATCGNGNDTVFLGKLVGENGHVFAFDIQASAIESAKRKTDELHLDNITYIQDSHALVDQYIPHHLQNKIAAAVFNLGYLPRSDKRIITKAESTITAIEKILSYIKNGGIVVVVVYHGHEGGKEEKDAVLSFVKELNQNDFAVLQYQFINQKNNPPFVIAIEKKQETESEVKS